MFKLNLCITHLLAKLSLFSVYRSVSSLITMVLLLDCLAHGKCWDRFQHSFYYVHRKICYKYTMNKLSCLFLITSNLLTVHLSEFKRRWERMWKPWSKFFHQSLSKHVMYRLANSESLTNVSYLHLFINKICGMRSVVWKCESEARIVSHH